MFLDKVGKELIRDQNMGQPIGNIEIGGSKTRCVAGRSYFLTYLIQALLPERGEAAVEALFAFNMLSTFFQLNKKLSE